MRPLISVVVPTRNERARIGAFLASIPDEVELVVVDASDDGTDRQVQALRPAATTRLIRSPAGVAAARQLGARAARGTWLLFTDADVIFAPGYFVRVAGHLHGDGYYGPKVEPGRYPRYRRVFLAGQRVLGALGIPAASGSNMAVRREVLAAVGGFRLDLPVNEDTELMLRLRRHGYHVRFAPDLQVYSLGDRRLARGPIRKLTHSVVRSLLLLIDLYVPLPRAWLQYDWGYWRHTQRTP